MEVIRNVLMADDEPDMLRFLKSQLSREYRVLEAVDGQQAIEKAANFSPDIILLGYDDAGERWACRFAGNCGSDSDSEYSR